MTYDTLKVVLTLRRFWQFMEDVLHLDEVLGDVIVALFVLFLINCPRQNKG